MLPPSLQSSLPAGWLAFTGRELNPLDRYKRFQITFPSSFSGFVLAQGKLHHRASAGADIFVACARGCPPIIFDQGLDRGPRHRVGNNADATVWRRDRSNGLLPDSIKHSQINSPMSATEPEASAQIINRNPRQIGPPGVERRAEEAQWMPADRGDVQR